MSFAAPIFLLGMLAVPLLLAAAVWARRRPARYAVRLPSVPTLAAVAPRVPAWRRWLPTGLLCLALAGLVGALARPEATVAVPVERASVMLVTDASGSMRATDVDPSRLQSAQNAARGFLDDVPRELRVGVVSFSDTTHGVTPPTEDRAEARAALDGLVADGGTATGDALASAVEALRRGEEEGKRPPAAIVLLSDGEQTTGREPLGVAREAARQGVPVYTVALGTPEGTITMPDGRMLPVPPDPATLQRIASISGGEAFSAQDGDQLDTVYRRLGSQIGTKDERREITAAFAAAGLLLLAGAVAGAVRWRGRLP